VNNCQLYASSPLNDMWSTCVGSEPIGTFAFAEKSVNRHMYFKKQLNSSLVNLCDALMPSCSKVAHLPFPLSHATVSTGTPELEIGCMPSLN
jgi:hypothetical protein